MFDLSSLVLMNEPSWATVLGQTSDVDRGRAWHKHRAVFLLPCQIGPYQTLKQVSSVSRSANRHKSASEGELPPTKITSEGVIEHHAGSIPMAMHVRVAARNIPPSLNPSLHQPT